MITTAKQRPLWVLIVAGGALTAASLGVRSTFGLFIDPISDGLGTGRGAFAFAIAVQNLMWGFAQPVAGALSDRYGAARTLFAGLMLYVASMLLMSTADSSAMLLLSGGFLTGIAVGVASFAVVLSAVGRMVDESRRSMALGAVSAIGSIGQFILVPVAQRTIDNSSWQTTAVILAIVLAATVVVLPFLTGDKGRVTASTADSASATRAATPLRDDLQKAWRSPSYLMLNGAFFVCGYHVTFIGVHLPGFVSDEGLATSTASTSLALIGLFNVLGSFGAGVLGGRRSKTKLLAGIYGLRAVVIATYVVTPITSVSTIVFGVFMGVLWLATVPLTSGVVTQQFGTDNSGALFGIVFLSHQLGSFLGAWLGGVVADATGSYMPMWWVGVALGVIALALHMAIDDGPVDEPPVRLARRAGRIRTGFAGAIVGVGGVAGVAPLVDSEARDDVSAYAFCQVGAAPHPRSDEPAPIARGPSAETATDSGHRPSSTR